MNVRGIGRLGHLARQAANIFLPRALILLYHRIAELPSDPQLLSVSPRHFAEHLEVIRKYACPLRQLVRTLQDGKIPRQAMAVTFDDGYADNLQHAKPALERCDVPATVFVATGFTGESREFWWDELERVLLQSGTLPQELRLNINGNPLHWVLGSASRYTEQSYDRNRSWNVEKKTDPTPRHLLYRSLHPLLRPLSEEERRSALDELLQWAGLGPVGRPSHRALSHEEVVRLADGGLIEIGAHTVTHPVLSRIAADRQQLEIKRSKADLEEILANTVISFAYPYGARADYNPATIDVVREAGFTSACSNFPGRIQKSASFYELPRYLVRDWDGEEFSRRLRNWFRD